jgi:hypothetical protein
MRKNIRRSILAFFICASAVSANAQPAIPRDYIEHPGYSLGLNFGMTDLWGDVGTQTILDHYTNGQYFSKPCFMGGIFGRFTPHPMIAARLGINYGTLYATDAWNKDKAKEAKSIEDDAFQRYLRNQDIRANVWEGTLVFEFFPLRTNSESKSASKVMQPYIVAGVGGFHFRPQSTLIDRNTGHTTWVDVHDLYLEGDGQQGATTSKDVPTYARKTNLWQFCVPVGLGLRWDLSDNFAFGFEYLYRFTMTDRLDNVSDEYASDKFYDEHLSPDKAALAKEMKDKSWAIDPTVHHADWSNRGNKNVLDSYSTISIMFIYKLKNNKIPWWY